MKRVGLVLLLVVAIFAAYSWTTTRQDSSEATRRFDIPTSQVVSQSDWETYNNSKYGYSFRYPKGWSISGANDRISLLTPAETAIRNSCIADGGQEPCGPTQTGSAYFEVMVGRPGTFSDGKKVATSINGQKAEFYIDPVVTERNYWVISADGLEFVIAAITANEAADEYQPVAVAIANTFTLNN